MQARVIVLGAAKGMDALTYAVPPEMEGFVECGHRVLVPVRSRKLTGVVVEVGTDLDAGGASLKPVLEVLEPTPLFDRPHLELFSFLASYYLVSLGEAYRNVIPAVARVESRRTLKLAREPAPLELATFNPPERAIVEALSKSAMTERQLGRLGKPAEVAAAIRRLSGEGLIGPYDATRGRHREIANTIVRLKAGANHARGPKQRAILEMLGEIPGAEIGVEEL